MATLNLEVIFAAKDKITGPLKAIIGGSNDLSKAFKQTSSDLKSLQDQQRKIGRFTELQEGLAKTNAALDKHKQTIQELKQQAKLGPLTQEQVKALSGAEAAVKRLTATYKNQSQEITATAQDLNKAGLSVNQLADHESELKHKIMLTTMELNKRREALDKNSKAQDQFKKTQESLKKGAEYAKTGLMIAGGAAAATTIPVKLAIDYESAMADVKKVFTGTDAQFKSLNDEIVQMSTRLPMAAKDIAAIVAAGGQSGIATNELTRFAETAVKMGVAFDISAQESGQAMAELRTAFKMSQDQVTTLADQINYLGNNTPAVAKGIMEIVQRIGPLGEVGGFAASSIAALGATMRGMGMAEEIAATGIKNMMLALVAGESATKGQKEAYKSLGLDYTKIAKQMQVDANGTTLEVLKAVSKLEKYKQAAVLKELFGSESLGAISPLLTNMQALETNFGRVADKTKYAGSMNAEYAARAATTANNIQLAKNSMVAIGITIGNTLLPAVNSMLDKFKNITNAVYNWSQANPNLASTLTKIAVGAIAVVGGISAFALVAVTVLGPLAMLKASIATLGIGFGAVGAIFSPVGLVILGVVAAVAGAAYLIYQNWGAISGFFTNLWTMVKNGFAAAVTGISSLIINWSPLGLFYSAFAGVLSWFGVDLPAKFTGFGAMILDGLKNGIMSRISAVTEAISGASQAVISKAKGVLGIHSPSRVFMGLGGYTMQGLANGISNTQGLAQTATANAAGGVASAFKPQFKSASLPSFGQAGTFSQQRGVTFNNNDKIEIHIDASGKGPLHNAANEVRKALEERERERMAIQRRMLSDRE